MKDIKKEIGQLIRYKRKLLNMTQQQLADQIDSTITTISTIEKGTANPTLNNIINISKVLEINLFNIL